MSMVSPPSRARRTKACSLALSLALGLLLGHEAAASTIWTFDLPATATASQDPPYPSAATLTLTQTADGVQFVLDPNQSSSGFLSNGAESFIERLDYVYMGPALDASDFRVDDGPIAGFDFVSNPHNMDAGYTADVFHIIVDFPSKNDSGRFDPDETRTWTVLGATLDQFTLTSATANAKPTPIYGVLSVSAYALAGQHPTPSNWVALVPEPGTGALLALGLGALGLGRARRPRREA